LLNIVLRLIQILNSILYLDIGQEAKAVLQAKRKCLPVQSQEHPF